MFIRAKQIVGVGFANDEGALLAEFLLIQTSLDWKSLTIDLNGLSTALLTSLFFSSFLQKIYDSRPEWLDDCRNIKWLAAHNFQEENIKRWMNDFRPQYYPI